jgi:hypothetical protein
MSKRARKFVSLMSGAGIAFAAILLIDGSATTLFIHSCIGYFTGSFMTFVTCNGENR